MKSSPAPPRILRAAVRASLPPEDREAVIGDLDDLYAARRAWTGRVAASAWYARQAAGFVVRVVTARIGESVGGAESYVTDAGQALRYFRRRPSFALAVVLTLGVGTGALVSVYAAAEWLLLRPVPGVAGEDALMTIRLGSTEAPPHVSWDVSHPDLLTLRERLPASGALAGRSAIEVDLRPPGGAARRVAGELVTANYFEVLGHALAAGRGFAPDEERLGARSAVAVVSDALARSLHGDPAAAIGADIRLNGTTVRVIGVTGPGFRGADLPGMADIWLPLGALTLVEPSARITGNPRGITVWRRMILRAGPEAAPAQMAAAANAVMTAVRREFRAHSYPALHFTFLVSPGIGLDPGVHASVERTLGLVAGAALFLLALAIANLVNLGLMESASRATAMAVRVALGSSRARMLRSLLVEAVLLAIGGATVAIALAAVWSRWFQGTQLSEYGGSLAGMQVNGLVILVSVLVATGAALLALVNPAAFRRSRSLDRLLRRGNSGAPAPQRLRMTLVGVQVALTVLLLVSAGLLTGTVDNLRRIDLGFEVDRLLVFSVDPHLHGYEAGRLDRLARDLESRVLQQPGITAAGFVSPSPLRSSYVTAHFYAGDDPQARRVTGAGYYVTPGFLTALGARVIAGDPGWQAQPGTVVLSRGSAAALFAGLPPEAAVGRLVPSGRGPRGRLARVAAVIEDVRLSDIVSEPPASFFRPLAERPAGLSVSGFVATSGAPMSAAPLVNHVLQARAPDLPIFDVRTARAAVDLQFAEVRAMALVANTLSGIGVLLSAIGLYGVLANAVAARRREIGIRAALGAAPGRLLGRVLLSGAIPVAGGLIAGTAGAAAAGRLLATHLFGVTPFHPGSYFAATAVVAAITAAACALPAYRASQVSPASVLREE